MMLSVALILNIRIDFFFVGIGEQNHRCGKDFCTQCLEDHSCTNQFCGKWSNVDIYWKKIIDTVWKRCQRCEPKNLSNRNLRIDFLAKLYLWSASFYGFSFSLQYDYIKLNKCFKAQTHSIKLATFFRSPLVIYFSDRASMALDTYIWKKGPIWAICFQYWYFTQNISHL